MGLQRERHYQYHVPMLSSSSSKKDSLSCIPPHFPPQGPVHPALPPPIDVLRPTGEGEGGGGGGGGGRASGTGGADGSGGGGGIIVVDELGDDESPLVVGGHLGDVQEDGLLPTAGDPPDVDAAVAAERSDGRRAVRSEEETPWEGARPGGGRAWPEGGGGEEEEAEAKCDVRHPRANS